jgi:hypothetical protein
MGLRPREDSPGGPCATAPDARYWWEPANFMIHDEIRTLLDAPAGGDAAPSLGDIEHTLTAGYARALALEAERWRLERRIAEVAAKLGDHSSEVQHNELAMLGQRLSLANGDLTRLRGLLTSLRSRAAEVRSAGVSV